MAREVSLQKHLDWDLNTSMEWAMWRWGEQHSKQREEQVQKPWGWNMGCLENSEKTVYLEHNGKGKGGGWGQRTEHVGLLSQEKEFGFYAKCTKQAIIVF